MESSISNAPLTKLKFTLSLSISFILGTFSAMGTLSSIRQVKIAQMIMKPT